MTGWPPLVVSAPVAGDAGARVAPLLAAIAVLCPARFIVATPSERDLAPAPAVTLAEWQDDATLARVPHLHILVDDAQAVHALRAALFRPGLVVLEDPGLARLHQAMTLDAGQPEAWLRLLGQALGPVGRRLGRAQLHGIFSPAQRHRMPMLDAVAETALAVVVRSRHALGFLPPGVVGHALAAPFPESPTAIPGNGGLGAAAWNGSPGTTPWNGSPGGTPPWDGRPGGTPPWDGRPGGTPPWDGRPGGTPGNEAPLLLLPTREALSPRALQPLREAAALAGARLLPWHGDADLAAQCAAATAALALDLPFGAAHLPALAHAMAAGLPVLAWEASPAAEWPEAAVARLDFPAEAPAMAAAIRRLLAQAGPRGAAARLHAATHNAQHAAMALLALLPGCRPGALGP